MRTLSVLLIVCQVCSLLGCSLVKAKPSKGHYRIDLEEICKEEDLVIVRVTLTFAGSRWVEGFNGDGKKSNFGLQVGPSPQDDLANCEMLLVAHFIDVGEARELTTLFRVRSNGVHVSLPGVYPVEAGESLDDVLDIRLEAGEYVFGSEVEIAAFRGQPLRIEV